jgi:hypothetical protein
LAISELNANANTSHGKATEQTFVNEVKEAISAIFFNTTALKLIYI